MTKASDNAFPSILITEGTEPAAPAAGKQRLYIDSTSHHLKRTDSGGTDVDLEAGAAVSNLVSASYKRTAGNYTTTSSSFGDVDTTNMNFTKTTGARRCLVGFMGSCESSVSADIVAFDILVDGASVGGTDGVVVARLTTASHRYNVSFTFMTDVLSAASHTFKIQWKRLAGTGTITLHGNSSSQVSQFWMTELYAA